MTRIGLGSARSAVAHSMEEALQVQAMLGYRSSSAFFTMAAAVAALRTIAKSSSVSVNAIETFPPELLIEESVIGWKEFEMEVVRTKTITVLSSAHENLDPMGVHTGDSITVAPAQTLTDKEYQLMRNASIRCCVKSAWKQRLQCPIAINPENGRMLVIEMNPRVSRSSALASKATGFRLPRSPPTCSRLHPERAG